jgi:2-polyprenyl-3-methyl-5-hydroxy-6-metoxy-1,4-benzoquinol methylase
MSAKPISRGPAHFERLYEASPDPWRFRESEYEQAKYRKTIAALGDRRFRSGFEVGCSIGVLTRLLAPLCARLLAVDMVARPLAAARGACADQPWVRFAQMAVPLEWPNETFDLIVLSEVLYFLSPADIAAVAEHVAGSLDVDGMVVLVNWRGESDDPCTGDEAAALFMAHTHDRLTVCRGSREAGYRLDVLTGPPWTG